MDEAERLKNLIRLGADQMEKLKKYKVNSVKMFLDRPNYLLEKLLDVPSDTVIEMKQVLANEQSSELVNGRKFLDDFLANAESYTTGVDRLDELFLNRGIVSGDIIEIFGLPATGKTMLLNTIMINILQSSQDDQSILFIDTQRNFSAMRLQSMMNVRGIPETVQHAILSRISIETVLTIEELISSLRHIVSHQNILLQTKVIIIDTISILYYLYLGNPIFCTSQLSKVVQLLKTLSMQKYTILITNSAIRVYEPEDKASAETKINDETDTSSPELAEEKPDKNKLTFKPGLGKYWEAVAHHKVFLNFVDMRLRFKLPTFPVTRHISLYRSKTLASTEPKIVTISNTGMS